MEEGGGAGLWGDVGRCSNIDRQQGCPRQEKKKENKNPKTKLKKKKKNVIKQ